MNAFLIAIRGGLVQAAIKPVVTLVPAIFGMCKFNNVHNMVLSGCLAITLAFHWSQLPDLLPGFASGVFKAITVIELFSWACWFAIMAWASHPVRTEMRDRVLEMYTDMGNN